MMISRDLVFAASEPLVLSVLSRRETYGYAIVQEVRDRSGGEVAWTEGILYPVLRRLESQGLVVSRWEKLGCARRRKYYRLSVKGARALAAERVAWTAANRVLGSLWKEGAGAR